MPAKRQGDVLAEAEDKVVLDVCNVNNSGQQVRRKEGVYGQYRSLADGQDGKALLQQLLDMVALTSLHPAECYIHRSVLRSSLTSCPAANKRIRLQHS